MVDKINFSDAGLIFLSKGKIKASGNPYWAYVMVPEDNLIKYFEDQGKPGFDLANYGVILHWDEGTEPPQKVKDEMAESYGTNENFTEDFIKNLKKTNNGKQFLTEVKKFMKDNNLPINRIDED